MVEAIKNGGNILFRLMPGMADEQVWKTSRLRQLLRKIEMEGKLVFNGQEIPLVPGTKFFFTEDIDHVKRVKQKKIILLQQNGPDMGRKPGSLTR